MTSFPRPVRIEFTRPKGKFLPIFSWAVRLIEGTPYSHVRIRWQSTSGEELVYEASGSSVKLLGSYSGMVDKAEVLAVHTFYLDSDQYKKLIRLFRYAGVKYGVIQIFGIALARLLRLKKNPLSKGKSIQVCSELAGLFISDVLGVDVPNLDLIGPRGIKELLDRCCDV